MSEAWHVLAWLPMSLKHLDRYEKFETTCISHVENFCQTWGFVAKVRGKRWAPWKYMRRSIFVTARAALQSRTSLAKLIRSLVPSDWTRNLTGARPIRATQHACPGTWQVTEHCIANHKEKRRYPTSRSCSHQFMGGAIFKRCFPNSQAAELKQQITNTVEYQAGQYLTSGAAMMSPHVHRLSQKDYSMAEGAENLQAQLRSEILLVIHCKAKVKSKAPTRLYLGIYREQCSDPPPFATTCCKN